MGIRIYDRYYDALREEQPIVTLLSWMDFFCFLKKVNSLRAAQEACYKIVNNFLSPPYNLDNDSVSLL